MQALKIGKCLALDKEGIFDITLIKLQYMKPFLSNGSAEFLKSRYLKYVGASFAIKNLFKQS